MNKSPSFATAPEIEREILTVSQLNRTIREVLEDSFFPLWIEGEISNFSQPGSGHIYFSLKDATAQVRCAMFRNQNRLLNFQPKNGAHVLLKAQISLYEERGDYQLIVESMEEAGDGALRRTFEQLKEKLFKEGLFDARHKKALPVIPQQIGVITSPTGAAIRDILTVLKRRFPAIPIIIYPTLVQGSNAAPQIVQALEMANRRKDCNILILARGGGSLEDLWPFNEELVARAIYASDIPIVSGIGHEVDITIADLVADHRAATPSAAAEMVSPHQLQWLEEFEKKSLQLLRLIQQRLQRLSHLQESLQKRLRHPKQHLRELMQRVDHLEQCLRQCITIYLHKNQALLYDINARFRHQNPHHQLFRLQAEYLRCAQRLNIAMEKRLAAYREQFVGLTSTLHNVSPLATLQRGYAIISDANIAKIIHTVADLSIGDTISAQLIDGIVQSQVTKVVQK